MQVGNTSDVAMQTMQATSELLKVIATKQISFQDKMVKAVVGGQVEAQEMKAKAQAVDTLA